MDGDARSRRCCAVDASRRPRFERDSAGRAPTGTRLRRIQLANSVAPRVAIQDDVLDPATLPAEDRSRTIRLLLCCIDERTECVRNAGDAGLCFAGGLQAQRTVSYGRWHDGFEEQHGAH